MNMHNIAPRALWFLPLVLSLSSQMATASGMEYPALGNIDTEEGTIEIWFAPMAELYPPDDGEYHQIFSLFSLSVPDEFHMACSWYRHRRQLGLKVSMRSHRMKDGLTGLLTQTPTTWKQGELHHVAFVWKGHEMKMLADGQVIGQKTQMATFTGKLGGITLRLGDPARNCPIILQAVRVSAIARDAESLTASQPVPDLATLLLDVFDQTPQNGSTTPIVISGLGDQQGRIVGTTQWVSAPITGLHLNPSKPGKSSKR